MSAVAMVSSLISVEVTTPSAISRVTLLKVALAPPVTVRSFEVISPSPLIEAISTSKAPEVGFLVNPTPATS